jgi:hypothetical protein
MKIISAAVVLCVFQVQTAPTTSESAHVTGPRGLQGWTVNSSIEGYPGTFPTALVLTRNGKIVRCLAGGPFLWEWMFVGDGRLVAYETAAMHGPQEYVLEEIDSGKIVGQYHRVDIAHGHEPPRWADRLDQHSHK